MAPHGRAATSRRTRRSRRRDHESAPRSSLVLARAPSTERKPPTMTRRLRAAHPLFIAALFLALALPPAAMAVRDPGGGSPSVGVHAERPAGLGRQHLCVGVAGVLGLARSAAHVRVDVSNADAGCSSSSFVVNVSAPSGFAVSTPTSTITSTRGLPATAGICHVARDRSRGDYPLTATVERVGTRARPRRATTRSTPRTPLRRSCTGRTRRTEPCSAGAPPMSGSHRAMTTQ